MLCDKSIMLVKTKKVFSSRQTFHSKYNVHDFVFYLKLLLGSKWSDEMAPTYLVEFHERSGVINDPGIRGVLANIIDCTRLPLLDGFP